MYIVCYFTFCAVCGVVQRWWVAIEVRRHLDRWAPDPVETIAKGDLIPTTSPTLEVTLWGWMRELGLAETGSSFMVLETGDLTSKFMSSSSGAFSQITRSRSALWSLPSCREISLFRRTKLILLSVFWKLQTGGSCGRIVASYIFNLNF